MELPLEITYENVRKSEELDAFIRERAAKLDRHHPRIMSCRIGVARPNAHVTNANPFQVRILCTVPPQHEVVAVKRPNESEPQVPLTAVIASAFDAVERQLQELAERQRGVIKVHELPTAATALVTKLFGNDGYGFIETADTRQIYFHRNSVAGDDFARLEVGTLVRFEEVVAEDGSPRATTVSIVDQPAG
jgi:cold shock CspA family protein